MINAIKALLGSKSKDILGLDIGLSAIKAAILKKSGDKFKLISYASIDLPEAALTEDEIQKPDEIIDAINEIMKQMNYPTKNVCIGLFGPNTFIKRMNLPDEIQDIDDQLSWEIEQFLPFSIEDAMIDHHIIQESDMGIRTILAASAKRDLVLRYKELVEKADLKVKVVDIQALAVNNVFEHILKDKLNAENSFLFLDIGAQKTECIIYQNNISFTKEINIGGVMITEEIQRQMGVNFEEAEDLKITTDESGNLPEEVSEIMNGIINLLLNELERVLSYYKSITPNVSFEECFITGGVSSINGLMESLERQLEMTVTLLNPFDKIDYDSHKIDAHQLDTISRCGAMAIGLAMRDATA